MNVQLSLPWLAFYYLYCLSLVEGTKIEFGDNYDVTVEEVGQFFVAPNQINTTRFYCTFRGTWTRQRHPAQFPALARWSSPVIFSHSLQYEPWSVGKKITAGVEKVAESGFSDTLTAELFNAGEQALEFAAYSDNGVGYFVYDESDPDYTSHVHVPPVEVNAQYAYLTSLAGMHPSPDWFTGFYNFYVADDNQRTYWDRFVIVTYPFDGGTDNGDTYTAVDDDLDPPENCVRISLQNAPNGIYVSPDGSTVLPVAEWDCQLVLGEREIERPECDYLKYPNCNRDECIESNNQAAGCMDCDPDVPSCVNSLGVSDPNQGRSGASTTMMATMVWVMAVSFVFYGAFVGWIGF